MSVGTGSLSLGSLSVGSARVGRLVWHQTRLEQRAFWRNSQACFFTFAIPVLLLVIFGAISHRIPGHPGPRPQVLLVPGFMAFGIIVAAYGNLAATIAFLRGEGVLKRIRSTPLPPGAFLTAQILSVVISSFTVAATCVLLGTAAFGVAPLAGRIPDLLLVLTVGIASFAALGLAISAAIRRADSAGPVTNATYIPLSIISGTFSFDLVLPPWLNRAAGLFPIKPFTDALRACYNPMVHAGIGGDLIVLAVWGIAGVGLAVRYFKWVP